MLIVDFYVDEPACFGVPPYLSTYCRYVAGALVSAGIPEEQVSYLTVDQWRAMGKELPTDPELLIVIAGHTVPGRYIGGRIGTATELLELLRYRRQRQRGGTTLIGGPIRHAPDHIRAAIQQEQGLLVQGDVEIYAYQLACRRGAGSAYSGGAGGAYTGKKRNYEQVDEWAVAGAFLTRLHPNFPYLMLELETYRGCTRDIFCSFCTEAFYGRPIFRSTQGIHREVAALYRLGNRYFRLGRQADLMTYLPDMQDFQNSFPRPRPQSLEYLYAGIRQVAPDLKVLHLDNINPGLMATFPQEARKIAQIICSYNTCGDTAAMGVETVDPTVIHLNDLKCQPQEALQAIEIINEYGGERERGIPKLLPGINFLQGLPGEDEETFEKNWRFLREILERGLLLRRINIRRTVVYEKTKLEALKAGSLKTGQAIGESPRRPSQAAGGAGRAGGLRRRSQGLAERLEQKFIYWRERIRQEIDQPMLSRAFPVGTRIEQVIPEMIHQGSILARPLGSYPAAIKIPQGDRTALATFHAFQKAGGAKQPLTVIVTGAQKRSLLGLSYPLQISRLDRKALEALPGYGARRATRLFLAQPSSYRELAQILDSEPFGGEESYHFESAERGSSNAGRTTGRQLQEGNYREAGS